MQQRGVEPTGRISVRLTRTFATLAAAPLVLSVTFFTIATRVGWLVISPQATLTLSIFAVILGIGGGIAIAGLAGFIKRMVAQPAAALTERARRLGEGDFESTLALQTDDELGALAESLNELGARLASVHGDLEEQIRQRSHELGRVLGELQLLKKLNDAIIHNIPSGLAILAADGKVMYFNAAFERTWGVNAAHLGRCLSEMVDGGPLRDIDWGSELQKLSPEHESLPGVIVEAGEWPNRRVLRYSLFLLPPVDLDVPLRLVGEQFCLGSLAPPHCQHECQDCFAHSAVWEGRHALLLIDDVTEQRHLEAQLIQSEKLAALGQLSAGIAHEIRNPLSAICSAAYYIGDVLTDDQPDLEDVEEYVRLIQRNVDRAQRTVTEILNFARPSGAQRDVVDLAELAQQTLAILDKAILDQGVTLEVDLDDGGSVHCRAEAVKQALLNLIVNGLQAMPDGGVLTVRSTVGSDGRPTLVVADTGTGIPAEHRRHIFNPFFTTKPVGQGTGLGLSIARQAIEADGGRVQVESEFGEGTTFRVDWPAAEPPVNEPEPTAATAQVD